MPGRLRARMAEGYGLVAQSLSGRLLLLTVLYVMVAVVLIFVPSVGRYHRELLDNHIESAELAVLPFNEPGGDALSEDVRSHLLQSAGALAVTLKSAERSQMYEIADEPPVIGTTIDLTNASFFTDMYDAVDCLFSGGHRVLYVIAQPTRIPKITTIAILLKERDIRDRLVAYSDRVIVTGIVVSLITGLLVFLSVYLVLVRPMRRVTEAMIAFRDNPENPANIVQASARQDEIGIAERELAAMQRDLYGSLQQKTRLAALGAAVARIQHDLRNILSNAQLASDRLTEIDDPVVKKLAPRLVSSIDRAVSLATNTLRYGRADERPPKRQMLCLKPLVAEAGEQAVEARVTPVEIALEVCVPDELEIDADAEQLYRVVLNLIRNAVEALVEKGEGGKICISAERFGQRVRIDIADTGPGIPTDLATRLFQPFATAARSGGSGLGLAIARDLARAHGGDISLVSTGPEGTTFRVEIPDRELL
ncbi:MAG: HAMP domain-containing histidine kinase [Alphaproteobacteria bacterium]|nr:HAMP domain-containing histidine kinase [Alphaproteobacteria bacterium]MBL7098906.1 HAMP domain-containing histidine kinase [Alphaproteobacteria bacterium]